MPNPATHVTPGDVTAPATPGAPSVVPWGRGLQISVVGYTPPADFYRYRFYKNGALWRESPTVSQIDYDVVYNTTYQYTVAAIDTALPANASAQSGIGSGTPVQVGGTDISGGAISSAHIQANSITSAQIQANTINSAHIQANAIQNQHIQANSISNAHIQANAIQTANILAGNITTLTIAAGNITNLTIADGAVSTLKVQPNAITGVSFVVLNSVNQARNAAQAVVEIPGIAVSRNVNASTSGLIVTFTGIWLVQNLTAAVVAAGVGVNLVRDGGAGFGTIISGYAQGGVLVNSPGPGNNIQMTAVIPVVDFPSAGNHSWTVTWIVNSTNPSSQVTATCQQAQLEVTELKR